MMKCSVHIATSLDGYIAKKDNSLDWLHHAGKPEIEIDAGWQSYIKTVDCMIMGRSTMQVISEMNLTPEQWPYGELRIIVLSNTLKEAPKNMQGKVEMYSGDLKALVKKLEQEGYQHSYIDGGVTVQNFINLKLLNEITISYAPVLLGDGIPLFANLNKEVKLENAKATAFANDFTQLSYDIVYSD
ncbi:dihydrofolate reductase family protein [Vibrio breoganii]|uniref:dihydrofolate reductase family protein n=1 Tax=Vibrio breoganii TaxID=553239 RepID=UPI001F53A0F1|nr:dihydrofolate reductase family protein [Vibrio breoganii]